MSVQCTRHKRSLQQSALLEGVVNGLYCSKITVACVKIARAHID